MKVLITGSSGMLGSDLVNEFLGSHDVTGLANQEPREPRIPFYKVDILDRRVVQKIFEEIRPDLVIHAAAHIDADDCEIHPERAFAINTDGTMNVLNASRAVDAPMIFLSSDYVYDGKKTEPYQETDEPNPLNIYGQSKVRAEQSLKNSGLDVDIVRTSWLFGPSGDHFFLAILRQIAKGGQLRVVNDQEGAPTFTKDLAKAIRAIAEIRARTRRVRECRIYHIANAGKTTWYAAAAAIVAKTRQNVPVVAISSSELARLAKRPNNSVFDLSKVKRDFGITMRDWQEAFSEYWQQSLEAEWQRMMTLR